MDQNIESVHRGMPPAGLLASKGLESETPFLHSVHPYFPVAAGLVTEWADLSTRLTAPPHLQSGWAEAWWRAFGLGTPELRTLRREGRLVGLLPIARRNKLLESPANYHTPGFGLLTEDTAASAALADELFNDEPTHVSLTSLDPDGASLEAFHTAAEGAGYRVAIRPFTKSLYLDVCGDWEGYERDLSRNMLRDLRRSARSLEREGKVSVEIVRGGEHLDDRMREAFVVEASGWKGAAGTAIQSDPQTQRFYTAIGRWAAECGTLRLYTLRVDRRPLAMCFALQEHGVCHLLKAGYDPAFGTYSPGKQLMHAMFRDCFENGVRRIELNGDAEPYKLSWANESHEYKRLEAFAPSVAGQLAWAAFTYSRPVASRLRERLGLPRDRAE
ncbi:MAG TPA: GNAT family N-acetyltransferase [Gammaproteobacteria bacterium]|jgi:CelD/BcsL family acetyltransferase involved in cellulose biosynthesis